MKGPRKVSPTELKRLKKKGKVRKKMGAQPETEKPVLAAPEDKGMSGSASTEPPAPAPIPAPAPVEQPMASMSASQQLRDGLLQDLIANNTQAIQDFSARLNGMKPAELSKWHRAAFVRHKVVRDKKSSFIDYVDSIPMDS